MSLYTLPVSVSDLVQLQLGIEFFPDTTEATTEAAAINAGTDTVGNYASALLAKNISLSQVAMAVDSLMFGVTDNTTELTKLAIQFLPPQVNNAVKYDLNPTVYAAEALGLGLASGNGTSTAFASNFGLRIGHGEPRWRVAHQPHVRQHPFHLKRWPVTELDLVFVKDSHTLAKCVPYPPASR
jgi:hypothetical protein